MKQEITQTSMRWGAVVLIMLISLVLFSWTEKEYQTLIMLVRMEAMALLLSSVAAYVYTNIDFVKESNTHVLGRIFLGVHILVGMTAWGIYFTLQSSSVPGL